MGDKKEYDHSAPIPVDDTHLVDEEFEDDFDDDFDDEDFSDLDDSYNT